MLTLPTAFISVMAVCAPVFSRPVWRHVQILITGAVLAPGKRTMTAILDLMGLGTAPHFQTYHRVLNRAVWSPLTASRLLLRLLVAVFVRRWTMEVTFEEARAHLGMETQRQWNARAIARTTPALLSLYTVITLTTHLLIHKGVTCVRRTAWYTKTRPTFADAIALVRRQVWEHMYFSMSQQNTDMVQIPRILLERFTEALCYAT